MSANSNPSALPFGASTRNPFSYIKVEQLSRDNSTAWLTETEITNQLNLFGDTSQDSYLAMLELAVRQAIEDYLGMSIFPITYRVWYGVESLAASPICIDLPEVSQNADSALPGVTINALRYWSNDFPPIAITVDPDSYYYDPSGNKVIISTLPLNTALIQTIPEVWINNFFQTVGWTDSGMNRSMTAPIFIDYSTTANPLAAYPVIKQAGLLLLTHLYNNRSDTTDAKLNNIPFGVATLLRPYKPLVM